jgi:hypothetical protein
LVKEHERHQYLSQEQVKLRILSYLCSQKNNGGANQYIIENRAGIPKQESNRFRGFLLELCHKCKWCVHDERKSGSIARIDTSFYSKIPPQTWQGIEANQTHLAEIIMKINGKTSLSKWAGSDLNQRTPPCQGGILTKLDHRPLVQLV